ncbi:hypothetical protein PHLCEN_2v10532 [Hermanssonia centrifuga]|uniref:WIBG Mago-binding domain-containing protein n=1 Tax=Hermanssonia centrifuga TaxID=98765 RepID=A0A2R6NMJ2_9APHY|nr:hypothetical protein PHLCEN_2v10532 [Hermanssonia centrifuga]
MSKPDIIPNTTASGIALDPRTLERVIPESRRPDGTVRKEKKIRPGFTPQEDVRRFRGTRQAQMDVTALPKGHIIGWTPPPSSTQAKSTAGMSKSAKKNEKRKEKRKDKKDETVEKVKDNWEDDDEEDETAAPAVGQKATNQPKAGNGKTDAAAEDLADKLQKLDVR